MRRRFLTRDRDEAEANLTPMLDVVFILLIFFIVTATFTREEAMGLEPPPPPSPADDPVKTTIVEISEDNLIWLNGRLTEIGAVEAGLQRIEAETPDRPVIVQAHPRASTGTVLLVRDQIYQTDIRSVNFALSQVE
ncbi:MAG: biopolymer transporter ExbD [Pseudomonadota bacterium]